VAHGEPIVHSLDLLSANVDQLALLHQQPGGISQVVGEPARQTLETQIRAIFKLEAELRAGTSLK
jgi:hypothetical protein